MSELFRGLLRMMVMRRRHRRRTLMACVFCAHGTTHVTGERSANDDERKCEGEQAPTHRCSEYNESTYSRARRNSCALMATMTVLADIRTAAKAGGSRMPCEASTPAAKGIATML